jgi:hypothetical protein
MHDLIWAMYRKSNKPQLRSIIKTPKCVRLNGTILVSIPRHKVDNLHNKKKFFLTKNKVCYRRMKNAT